MLYQPNFCNNCGEAVERLDRKLWNSTRFCENCESEFRFIDWFPRIGVVISLLLALLGFGSYLKTPDKPLNVTNNQFTVAASNKNQTEKNSNISKVQSQTNVTNVTLPNTSNIQNPLRDNTTLAAKPSSNLTTQNIPEEPVYFCGAQTKKGSPCTRKVKGGGRCWQHTGQPAMLPKEKLVVSN